MATQRPDEHMTEPRPESTNERCARCGAPFYCAMNDASGGTTTPCWCAQVPPRQPNAEFANCLCASCIEQLAVSHKT